MFDLQEKTALVTGAARGIGRQSALALGSCGAAVMLTDIEERLLADTYKELEAKGIRCSYAVMDVADDSSIKKAVDKTAEDLGGIDILVNSAGILGTSDIEHMDKEKEWERVIGIDLTGTFFVSQSALKYLKESKAGRIINIASLAGRNGGFAGSCSYAAAKGGVIAMTRNMARSFAVAGLRITANVICPGPVWTEIQAGYTQEKRDLQLANIPMGRFGTVEEVAAAVCYLASDEAAFTTGATLDINGGAFIG